MSARLGLLADLVTGGTAVPAPVLVAVVHGELLALAPFGSANGVVARAAARLTAVASRPGPEGPRGAGGGAPAARRASTGAPPPGSPRVAATAIAAWLLHCCAQWEAGAREGLSIADART